MHVGELIERARELARLREKATPGPWQWEQNGLCDALRNADGEYVFDIRTDYDCGMEWELDKQTAALIAAAPEMAELLEMMADELEKFDAARRLAEHVRKMKEANQARVPDGMRYEGDEG